MGLGETVSVDCNTGTEKWRLTEWTEPQEHGLHDEAEARHRDPIGHPVDEEADTTILACKVDEECKTDEGEMKRNPKVA